MPLSYAVILGGSMTMIGTSVNLFVNDLIDSAGLGRLGIFSIIGVGLPLTIGCVLLMVLLGPRLLKARTAPGEVRAGNEREFTVEMTIPFDSAMAGATVAEAGLNGRALNYPRGRVLGGCSAINGMIYMRGQSNDYDHWRQLGNVGWGWDDVLPYFRKSEDYVHGADDFHGAGGEWRVEEMRLTWEILDAFRDAAAEAGIPKISDFNRGDNEGSAYFQVNQKRGVRWTTAKGFLRPVRQRANL
mgnify:CR=1 FL=1